MKSQVADIVFVKNNKVLLVQQRKQSAFGLWSYPGGRVEENETLEEALKREIFEELGANITEIEPFKTYQITTNIGPLEINTFVGKLVGEINLNQDELMDFKWLNLVELEGIKDSLRSELVFKQAIDVLAISKKVSKEI